MIEQFEPIGELLRSVRKRWRWQTALDALARAVFALAALVAVALVLAYVASDRPRGLAAIAAAVIAGVLAALAWTVHRAGRAPSDRRVARFIEERDRSLDERLVSAVAVATQPDDVTPPRLAGAMVADAARAARAIDPSSVVPDSALRRAALLAAAACCLVAALMVGGRNLARQSFDALALSLFPSSVSLEVVPGDARVQAGSALRIGARLIGNRAPVGARLFTSAEGSDVWDAVPMEPDGSGGYQFELAGLTSSFRYKVLAGSVSSEPFDVAVVRAPRVERIDVEYTYPRALALPSRVEQDSGDIYAPAGTDVKVLVHTDAPAETGRLNLGPGTALDLRAESPTLLSAALRVTENGSYRVALTGREGFSSDGETEYFIRILDDRPPDVRVVRPASDRRVTRLEEVEVTAEAEDDFGISALELVYSLKGGPEKVVPLGIAPRSTSVSGHYVFYLEDLDVNPGDLVAYYARARDLARGKPPSESRSDIFFLEVKPFEEEFTLAQTQVAMGGGGGNPQLDDLVAAQKEIVVATWKLDRRSRDAQGARSEQDIRSVAKAERALKVRVEQTSSSFRTSSLRDPHRSSPPRPQFPPDGPPQPPQPLPPGAPRAGRTTTEEDAMTQASAAMARAVSSLDQLKTADALPHEIEALNALLSAQSDVKKRQVQQQAGSGSGQNRSTEDLSSLFDKELAKNQQTNYETRTSTEQKGENEKSLAERIKELAQRQDELVRRQQRLARGRSQMTADEAKRELEGLTRDQNDLRERAEDMTRDLSKQRGEGRGASDENQAGKQAGQSGVRTAGQDGQVGSAGQSAGQSDQGQGQGQGGDDSRQMRDISNEMRNAASELRREDAEQASARAARALDKLRELERQLQGGSAEGRRRALGDLQLEARQLAETQRQIAADAARAQTDDAGRDALRRLAGEQDRVAERLQRVEQSLKQQASGEQRGQQAPRPADSLRQAASDAAREIERQRLPERMQQTADAMRKSAEAPPAGSGADAKSAPRNAGQADAPEDLARALERLADRLSVADVPMDDESRKLNEQVARVRELREQMDEIGRRLQNLDAQRPDERGGGPDNSSRPGAAGKSGQTGQGDAGGSGDPAQVERLRTDLNRQMQQVGQLLRDAQSGGPSNDNGGAGTTLQGQGMVLSAPGTQGFKQDFARWQELSRQITLALDNVEASLAQRLQGKAAKDRLASGVDEKVSAEYEQQVDSYFKALATRKRP